MKKGISYIVTCEEQIKSLKEAELIIHSTYSLGEVPFMNVKNRLLFDIQYLRGLYEKELIDHTA